jgi:hypothetical protein
MEGKDYHLEAMMDNDDDEWGDAGRDEEDEEDDEDGEDGAQSLPSSVASTVESSRSNIANKNANALAEHRAEEKRVFSLKIFVVTLFLIVSVGVSLAIYGFVNQQENKIFETKVRVEECFCRHGFYWHQPSPPVCALFVSWISIPHHNNSFVTKPINSSTLPDFEWTISLSAWEISASRLQHK